ncbi:MAG: CBS domain-containing protein [Saprospiraceae bacterium]|nr:CBS domain-containing protein [Saprospiraceae bacterium]
MNLLAPVSEIMKTKLVTVSPNDSIEDVRQIFQKHRIHHLPVVHNGELVGMLSLSDYKLFSHDSDPDIYDRFIEEVRRKNFKVRDIMIDRIATLEPDDRVNVALEVFRENRFHALPVIDKDRALLGIVTTFDIVDFLARDQKAEMTYK